MVFKVCPYCDSQFEDRSRSKNKKFCCLEHKNKHRWLTQKEALTRYNKQYEINNAQKVKDRKNRYRREKYRSDPNFALSIKLRVRINRALTLKRCKFLDLIGCSVEELKQHIESKFQPGMTWDNYGEWEIDHVRPMSSFDLSTEEGQRAACHYTNLQPMWASENRAKGSRLAQSQDIIHLDTDVTAHEQHQA